MIFQEKLDYEELFEKNQHIISPLLAAKPIEMEMIPIREESKFHKTYLSEKYLGECVIRGDVAELKKAFSNYMNKGTAGKLSNNSMRHKKNILISVITMTTRSAIQGGLPEEEAFLMSDLYIQELEELTELEEIRTLAYNVMIDFADKVKQHRYCQVSYKILSCQKYIVNHLYEKLSVSEIAEELHMNISYLSSQFKKETGVNRHEYNGHTAGLLSIASLLMLMPQIISVPVVKNIPTEFPKSAVVDSVSNVEAFQTVYTGSTGLIVAIIIGFIVSLVYIQLSKRNLVIKLPAGVPPMVVDSLSPAIISMVIFCLMFGIRVGFSYTPFHDIFNLSTQLIQAPLTGAVANPWVLMGIFTFGNFLWFFGIHPNLIGGILDPLLLTMSYANIDAYAAGKPVPYLQMMIVFAVGANAWGGSGNTYGLVISMFTAKSERYKQLLKLGAIASIFNISEPLLFGLPMMLNPIFFIPLVFQPAILGTVALGLAKILNITNLNPMTALLPWTTPAPVRMAISGGLPFLIIFAICLVLNVLIYYPFFKVADNKALEEEKAAVELEGSETA